MPWYCLAAFSSKNSQDNLIEPSDNLTKILYEQFGLAKSYPKLLLQCSGVWVFVGIFNTNHRLSLVSLLSEPDGRPLPTQEPLVCVASRSFSNKPSSLSLYTPHQACSRQPGRLASTFSPASPLPTTGMGRPADASVDRHHERRRRFARLSTSQRSPSVGDISRSSSGLAPEDRPRSSVVSSVSLTEASPA